MVFIIVLRPKPDPLNGRVLGFGTPKIVRIENSYKKPAFDIGLG